MSAKHLKGSGGISHDDPNTSTSAPVKIGFVAKEADGTDPGSVAEDDRLDFRATRQGAAFVDLTHPFFFVTSAVSSFSVLNSPLIGAPPNGLKHYITDVAFGYNSVGTISLWDGTITVAIARSYHPPSGSSYSFQLRTPIRVESGNEINWSAFRGASIQVAGYLAP